MIDRMRGLCGALCALMLACGTDPAPETAMDIPETLSAWGLFADAPAQTPADDVIPFDVTAPLYSDGSLKRRYLRIPKGEQIGYSDSEAWSFPVGTVLVKTFGQRTDEADPDSAVQLIETRLLVRGSTRWTPLTYVWNDGQDEAYRVNIGELVDVTWTDAAGELQQRTHVVPNSNECRDCHGTMEHLDTLGGNTRMLNRAREGDGQNQIDHLAALGLFDRTPAAPEAREQLADPFGDAPLWDRARAYMDSNCGSCHRPGRGEASQSGFFLAYSHTDPASQPPANWGVCKVPTSAGGATCGLTHDVVPGDPDSSILICRMATQKPKVMMPPLGRTLVDEAGVSLLRAWVEQLPPADCE